MTNDYLIAQKVREIAASADLYPGVVIVHNCVLNRVEYMSARGLALLQVTQGELHAMGPAYLEYFFNPQEAHEYVPKLFQLLELNDLAHTVSFFQQVRTGPGRSFEWYLSASRLIGRTVEGQPLLLLTLAQAIDPASHISHKVQRLLDENTFLRAHYGRFATLTAREREVLRGVVLGESAPEIAERLFISPQTAETHRRNLRRKLQAESAFELGQYARAFDLI
ncbi:LuxR C-terminal-related transcriptional regulator [Hymenobacter cheonanensis]|uniref:LuxR C-terminal-related transcriptional regulator n=1 Tax=Hymenobacter sp. CA2-7 TaxID=3063993 RepID=UPI00271360F1|nr:helix-turn-helix transcriptional regulator [Hymenobacter sp. CA2-7]MDO7884441.1 helix-turn-helix transcriptional regulator [Hymenobacter sp. CA2-7]